MRLKTYSFNVRGDETLRTHQGYYDEDDYQGYYDEDDYADSQDAGFLTPEDEMVSWCASFDG